MEYGLWLSGHLGSAAAEWVLILVLMEYGLWLDKDSPAKQLYFVS